MDKKLIIFDMDGTLYLGKNLFDGVLETFDYLNKEGIRYIFFTNNSSHDLDFYYQKMKNFSIPCTLEDNFYSSVEVTISYLLNKGIKKIYCIGNKSLKNKLANYFTLIDRYDEKTTVEAVVAGFSTELIYEELKGACLYLETLDIPFIATNGDYRCPIEDGLYIPDCGGMCEWIARTVDKAPLVMGKPNPEIVYYFLNKYNLNKEDILLVGDRLYTDIKVGINAEVDTLCVLSGESSLEDINNSTYKPTYILDSVKDLPKLLKGE